MNMCFAIPLDSIVEFEGASKQVRFVGTSGYYLSDIDAIAINNRVPGTWVCQSALEKCYPEHVERCRVRTQMMRDRDAASEIKNLEQRIATLMAGMTGGTNC